MTQQYMLLFSLGPVQSFIAQARKTRDLWLGSFLLSALMQSGMQDIKQNLIFPYKPFIEKKIPDLPNKYIAIFNTSEEAVLAATNSETNIKQFWNAICKDVWQEVLEKPARFSPITRTLWEGQTNPENVFELFWVVVGGETAQYRKWLTETQSMFDRRKHLRDFTQQIEIGEKSTISGQRAALRGAGEWRTDVQTFWYQVAKAQSSKDISADGTERLDAIDTVKRFAYLSRSLAELLRVKEIEAGFPSTSSTATATFMERLITTSESPLLASPLSTWFSASKKLGETMPTAIPLLAELAKLYPQGSKILEYDGECFFPETFSAKRLEKEFRFDGTRKDERDRLAKDGPNAIAALLRQTDELNPSITRPTPYYAMIQMDGDKMGRLINGVGTVDEHKAISQALSTFSRENAPAIVEAKYPGRVIYAGGDDVFALAPLARDNVQVEPIQEGVPQAIGTVLDLVDQLQQQYRSVVRERVVNDISTTVQTEHDTPVPRKELVTASVGIAIAHHYTSLSYVRRVSKEAEHLAKEQYERNALVVTVLRRSGEQTRVGCKWLYPNLADEAQPMRLFARFYALFVNDVLSPSAVHTLLEEAPTLIGLPRDAQASEIKRVLKRQRDSAKKEFFSDRELETKAQYLVDLAEKMDGDEGIMQGNIPDKAVDLHAEERRYGLVEVLGWLLVLLFLARKEQA